MKKIFLLFSFLLLVSRPLTAGTVTVFHTSDVHGAYSAHKAGKAFGADSSRMIGGFPVLKSYLDAYKTPYILLDSGDTFQGTPEGIVSKGIASAEFMNLLHYDAMTAGNHDFDYGSDSFKNFVRHLGFPMLVANLFYVEGYAENPVRPDYVRPYVIIKKAGEKIAVIGLAGMHTATSTKPENVAGLLFENEAVVAESLVREVREKEKPDAVIVLLHNGINGVGDISGKVIDISGDDSYSAEGPLSGITVARAAKGIAAFDRDADPAKYKENMEKKDGTAGIDLILGGHEHTGLLKGYFDKETGTWFGESFTKLDYVTKADLNFDDKTGKLTGIKVELVPLWQDQYGENRKALKLVEKYQKKVKAQMSEVVGRTAFDMEVDRGGLDSPVANWVCDVTREEVGADMAFQNTGGIRSDIKAGDITLRDIYQVMPFDNTIYTLKMTGAAVTELIKDNLQDAGVTTMQISGITVEYRVGEHDEPVDLKVMYKGKEIDPKEIYSVSTNDYLVNGGDGGAAFRKYGTDIVNTGFGVREAMIKSLEPTLKDGPLGRYETGRFKELK